MAAKPLKQKHPHIATTADQVVDLLRTQFPDAALIAVDGLDGVGKTTLQEYLKCRLPASGIDLDHYLIRGQDQYVQQLKLNALRVDIQASPTPLVLSGVFMLEVLGRLSVKHDVLLYIKRMARWGWADEEYLCPAECPMENRLSPERPGRFHRELVSYHDNKTPHIRADIILELTHCPPGQG